MSQETFGRILDQTGRHLEFAYLHLAGEPLLNPQYAELIAEATRRGLSTGLSTNGILLDADRAARLIDSGLSSLVISIDGTDAATYRAIRGADSFERVVANAEGFLRLKAKAGRGPRTVMQMTCMHENEHQAEQFVRRWRALGADTVRLKRFFTFAGTVEDRSYDQPRNPGSGATGRRPPCFLLWRQMAFYYDGTAVSCCHDFLHRSVLGDINRQTLAEIWNGPAMVEMRRRHLEGRQDEIPLCGKCDQPRVGLPHVAGTTLLNAGAAKRALFTVERLARLAHLRTPY
jgi:MoaA/NifB/PqqE/SkfB family radical SAM enzyme